jgi:FAD:protein FMN transferase
MLQIKAKFNQMIERAQPWLGTIVTIRAYGRGAVEIAVEKAFASIADIHRKMSFHEHGSELSLLNQNAFIQRQAVSHDLYRVIQASKALAKASDGIFDPTVATLLVKRNQLPAPSTEKNDLVGNWRDINLLANRGVQFLRPLWIDLGGIAKGYAVDQAIRMLRKCGVDSGIVNAGGDIRTFGCLDTIHVRDPANPQNTIPVLHVRDAAVATSAGYFSGHLGHTALVNPMTSCSMGHDISVTVVARRAIWADALTKVIVISPSKSVSLLQRLHASALILHKDGSRQKVN